VISPHAATGRPGRHARGRLAALIGASTLAAWLPAFAAAAVEVQVTSVRASDRGPSDANLQDFRPRLRRLVGYRAFRIVQDERQDCAWGSAAEFHIPGGRLLRVVPKQMREQAVVMQVRLVEGERRLVDTDVRLQNRGVMLFGVGQDSPAADGALIIMLRAEE
jgi:hypothetical protein